MLTLLLAACAHVATYVPLSTTLPTPDGVFLTVPPCPYVELATVRAEAWTREATLELLLRSGKEAGGEGVVGVRVMTREVPVDPDECEQYGGSLDCGSAVVRWMPGGNFALSKLWTAEGQAVRWKCPDGLVP